MSDQQPNHDISRRNFMKAAGTVAGAGLLGAGAAGTASAATEFDPAFANWRVREAQKVWERGYTGRFDRTIGLTDSGIEARHPDLGPWNGVRAEVEGGTLVLKTDETVTKEFPTSEFREFATEHFEGTTGPGAGVVGFTYTTPAFTLDETRARTAGSIADGDTLLGARVEATLSWNQDTPGPQANDADFELQQKQADGSWQTVASSGSGGLETQEKPTEDLKWVGDIPTAKPSSQFRFYVVCWRGATTFSIDAALDAEVKTGTETREGEVETDFTGDVFGDTTDKVVGWFDAGPRYGTFEEPRDGNGHGTHCSSIMGGTGQASTVDEANLIQDDPYALVFPTQPLTYTVDDVDADGGVFVAAYGESIQASIVGPNEEVIESASLDGDHSLFDNTLIDHPAVHESGTATYTVHIEPLSDPDTGVGAVGRAKRVATGPLLPPEDAGDGSRDGSVSLHAGLAPNAGLVGLQGLSEPTMELGEHADAFAETFNMRAVNMSWGYVGGIPLGFFGGNVSKGVFGESIVGALRKIAHGGILPVTAAGNAATPANGNGAPNVADEAISVAATDPVDGLTSYSSGGIGGFDEDTSDPKDKRFYMKPEVTAPGGAADGYPAGGYDLVRAAKNGDPNTPESDQPPIRDYTLKAGTSMAAPYVTGTTGLVAEAMEFDDEGTDRREQGAPDAVTLPDPANTGYTDVMRLKQAILATASETAFTAAPFHHPSHRPTYDFGGRDPYEGFGRVNPDAAVDAVSRELFDGRDLPFESAERTVFEQREELGLNVPADSRAVAGYAVVPRGQMEVSVDFANYSGGNKGMTKGAPHIDLFVYDAGVPGANGAPNVVAKAQGREGSASVTVATDDSSPGGLADSSAASVSPGVFYVVAKLVNVPGVVNTYDVQAQLDLTCRFERGKKVPYTGAVGKRADDGAAFTGGQSDQIDVTVTDIGDAEEVELWDVIPASWTVDRGFGDVVKVVRKGDRRWVNLGSVSRTELGFSDGSVTRTYFANAPEQTGEYTLGPAQAKAVGTNAEDFSDRWDALGGTDRNVVVGVSTNTDDATSSATDETDSATDSTESPTDTVRDTVF